MGKRMVGTKEFALFRRRSICTGGGGGSESGRRKSEKCLPAGTGPSCGVIIWSNFGLLRGHYLIQVCFCIKALCQKKHYNNSGFSPFFLKKKRCAQKFQGSLSGPSLRFLKRTQLGPDTDPYLDQIMTPQNACFCNLSL